MAIQTKSFVANAQLTAAELNTYTQDNFTHLLTMAKKETSGSAEISTTNTAFANIPNVVLVDNCLGGLILVNFTAYYVSTTPVTAAFDLTIDGVSWAGTTNGIFLASNGSPVSFSIMVSGVAAGSRAFRVQWKLTSAGIGYLSRSGNTKWAFNILELAS